MLKLSNHKILEQQKKIKPETDLSTSITTVSKLMFETTNTENQIFAMVNQCFGSGASEQAYLQSRV